MPTFDAGKYAEALDFDFRKAGVDAHGTIPEPTDTMIGAYLEAVKKAFTGLAPLRDIEAGKMSEAAMLQALEKVDADEFVRVMDELSQAAAALCGGTPTLEQIRRLPLRVRQHFFYYLQSEVANPEVEPGDGTVLALAKPRSAAG